MPERRTPENSGFGVLVLLGLVAGLAVGLAFGEPSAGTVGGFILGAAAAAVLWWRGRR